MSHPFLKNFDIVAIVAGMASINIVERTLVSVPGFIPLNLMLLALGCIFATRIMLARPPETVAAALSAAESDGLHSAFDFANDGIVLLDEQLRAIYANKEFRRLFQIPDAFLASHPGFSDMVALIRSLGIYQIEENGLDDFCAQRLAFVQAGDAQPLTLRLAQGVMIRSTCSVLPGGGRMLTYANITDLVNDAQRLENLANIDGLTGLVNRRRFFDLAARDWALATRYNRPVAVLMIDIDHFKMVNDTYGHDVGDAAISHVAAICKESKRTTDVVARVGGEEFALLLPETDLAGALTVAERIRLRVAANGLASDQGEVRLTVSIGVALRQADTPDFLALLKRSDQLLYVAKRGGRNQVAHDEPSPLPPPRLTIAA